MENRNDNSRADAALLASEARLRIAVDACALGVFDWDIAADVAIWENDRAYEIFGHTRQDGTLNKERFLAAYLHPDDRIRFESDLVSGMKPGALFHTVCRIQRKDLQSRWLEMAGRFEFDSQGVPLRLIGIISDVTERQESQKEREQLALLINNSHEFIALYCSHFELLFINEAGMQMVGLSNRSTALQTKAQNYFFPEDRPWLFGEFFPRVSREGHGEVEVRLRDFVTGRPIWVVYRVSALRDANGSPTAFSAMGLNVTERRETEERLRISEERFRSYFELGLIGMAITSPSQGILEANDKICEILGYERDELLRMTWAEITHPDDLTADSAQFERVVTGAIEAYQLEKRWIRKGGSIVHSVISVKCLRHRDGSINHIVALLQDVTDRKRADSHREFLADVNGDFAHLSGRREIVDVACKKLLIHLNLSRCAFANIDEKTQSLTNIYECVEGDLPGLDSRYRMSVWFDHDITNQLSSGEIVCVDDVTKNPSTAGTLENYEAMRIRSFLSVPFVRDGRWEFCLGVFRGEPSTWGADEIDVVREFAGRIYGRLQRADADARLQESEEHLKALVNQSVGGIAEADLTGRITLVNATYCDTVGYTSEELLGGMTLYSLTPPEELESEYKLIVQLLATGEPFQIEKRCVRKDSSSVWVMNNVSCIRNADGTAESLISVGVDINERKLAEAHLQSARAELEQRVQDRTADLSSTNVALQKEIVERHKIEIEREELMRRLVDAQEEERRRIARELHDDFAQRLAALQMQAEMSATLEGEAGSSQPITAQIEALLRDLRDLSHRLHPSILEDLGLEVALKTLLDTVAVAQGLTTHFDVQDIPPEIPLTSSTAIYRIAQEALRNVVKHAGPGTAVTVNLSCGEAGINLSIKDEGAGFDLQLAKGHTGMGLASMRERARLLGGELKLDSKPGSGTTVTAIVPWTRRNPTVVPRVVVCDDDPQTRQLLINSVASTCEVVGQAENGLEALDSARRLHPDVMLLDISMPGIGGLEVACVLRERFPRMRIIFVTERSEPAYIDHAFALGAQGYVIKSRAASELQIAIREVAAGRLFRSSLE